MQMKRYGEEITRLTYPVDIVNKLHCAFRASICTHLKVISISDSTLKNKRINTSPISPNGNTSLFPIWSEPDSHAEGK